MDMVKVAIREALLLSNALVALIGDRIHPSKAELSGNPEFPCITLSREGGGTNSNRISDDVELRLDVWCKGSNDELWQVYNEAKTTINLQPLDIEGKQVFLCRETYVNDGLYESGTKTHHLTSKYKIISRG